MPQLEEFATISGSLDMDIIGSTPNGMRINFPFSGTATSSHWEGERPVTGIDYVTVRSDGHMNLEIQAVIGEGRKKVAYSAGGISLAGEERGSAFPKELVTFETADEDLAFLNTEIAVALGSAVDGQLELTMYLVKN